MAPSAGKSPPGTQNGQSKIPTEIVVGWPQNDTMRVCTLHTITQSPNAYIIDFLFLFI